MTDQGDLIISILKKRQDLKISSWETKQNWNCLLNQDHSQSVRYGGRLHDGSGQPDIANSQEVADSEIFVMGSDAAEFVNKVRGQVRKRQKRMSNVAHSGHSIIWGMYMAATMNAATFMGKNFLDNQNSIMNSTDLTLKKMFEISENWWANKKRSTIWTRFIGKEIHGNNCH